MRSTGKWERKRERPNRVTLPILVIFFWQFSQTFSRPSIAAKMKRNNFFNGASLSKSPWTFDKCDKIFKDTVNQDDFFANTGGFIPVPASTQQELIASSKAKERDLAKPGQPEDFDAAAKQELETERLTKNGESLDLCINLLSRANELHTIFVKDMNWTKAKSTKEWKMKLECIVHKDDQSSDEFARKRQKTGDSSPPNPVVKPPETTETSLTVGRSSSSASSSSASSLSVAATTALTSSDGLPSTLTAKGTLSEPVAEGSLLFPLVSDKAQRGKGATPSGKSFEPAKPKKRKLSQQKFDELIGKSKTYKCNNKGMGELYGKTFENVSCKSQGLELRDREIVCTICSCPVETGKLMQHCYGTVKHFTAIQSGELQKRKMKSNSITKAVQQQVSDFGRVGGSLTLAVNELRTTFLNAMWELGTSLNSFAGSALKKLFENGHMKQLGSVKNLHASVGPAALDIQNKGIIYGVIRKCSKMFSVVIDGTGLDESCECVVLLFVDKKLRVRQFLWRIALHKKGLKHDEMAELLSKVLQEGGLDLNNVLNIIADRASVNLATVNKLKEDGHNIEYVGCVSHTLCHVGENMNFTVMREFGQNINATMVHPGCKARMNFLTECGERYFPYGQTRWWSQHEKGVQFNKIGLAKIMKYLRLNEANEASQETTKKALALLERHEVQALLPVEMIIWKIWGNVLTKATYNLEGDNPLIFVADEEMAKVELALDDVAITKELEEAIDRGVELMKEPLKHHRDIIADADAARRTANDVLETKKRALAGARQENVVRANSGVRASNRARTQNQNYRQAPADMTDLGAAQQAAKNARIKSAKLEMEAQQKIANSLEKVHKDAEEALNKFKAEFPATKNDFRLHMKKIIGGAKEYYDALFKRLGGKMFEQRRAMEAAGLFNTMAWGADNMELRGYLEKSIDDLKYFGYEKFTEEGHPLQLRMKCEIEEVITKWRETDSANFWENDPLSADFERQRRNYLERQRKKNGNDENEDEDDLEDDNEVIDVDAGVLEPPPPTETRKRQRDYHKPWYEVPGEKASQDRLLVGH